MSDHFICPFCSSTRVGKIDKYRGRNKLFDNTSVIECLGCSAWSTFPVIPQENLSVLYEEDYWTDEIYSRRLPYLEAQMKSRCEFISSVFKPKRQMRVMDVGASLGVLNRVARNTFNNVEIDYNAIEVNSAALKYLKHNCDNNKIFKTIEETTGRYDVIFLSHILEHISDPIEFLMVVSEKLRDDGVVFIEIPNCDFRFKKYHQPHMFFYTISAVEQLLRRAGFSCLKLKTCGRKVRAMQVEANLSQYTFWEKVGLVLLNRMDSVFTDKESTSSEYSELISYGGDRRWIRLVAKKNND